MHSSAIHSQTVSCATTLQGKGAVGRFMSELGKPQLAAGRGPTSSDTGDGGGRTRGSVGGAGAAHLDRVGAFVRLDTR